MPDIEELGDTAQRLRVMWRKTNNYYASFASVLFDTRKRFEAGEFPGWAFEDWLFQKAGLSAPFVMQQLKVFNRVISAEAREKVEQENARLAVEKRMTAAREKAEKRAAAAQKRIVAAHQRREKERLRGEKEAQAAAAKAAKAEAKTNLGKAAKKAAEAATAAQEKQKQRMREYRENRKVMLQSGPENPELRRLLAECQEIDKPTRPQLGQCYLAMKTIVENKKAGKDPSRKWWTWGTWVNQYLHRTRRDADRCIEEYQSLSGNFRTSCPNTQNENVLKPNGNYKTNQSFR